MAWLSLITTLAKSCTWQNERVALYNGRSAGAWSAQPATKEGSIIMTYNEFLERYCRCYGDAEGNRPCDNGACCDRCMTDEMVKLWKEVHDND